MTDAPALSVVAPCFREEKNIATLVSRLSQAMDRAAITFELILVDDGSDDHTWSEIVRAQSCDSRIRAVKRLRNGGMHAAWVDGVATARASLVCLIDADLQNPPEAVPTLFGALHPGIDAVQGVRHGSARDVRWALSRGLNALVSGAFGLQARDIKSGFIIAPRASMRDALDLIRGYHYPMTFIRVALSSLGVRFAEVDTAFHSRAHGESYLGRLPLRATTLAFMDVVRARVSLPHRPNRAGVQLQRYVRHAPKPTETSVPSGLRRVHFEAYFATSIAHKWTITRAARELYLTLDRTQWLSPDAVRTLQNERLASLVEEAARTSPFYRDRWAALGIDPRSIRTLDDLRRLPLTSKDDVRSNLDRMLSETHRARELLSVKTSGSTGEPMRLWADRMQLEMRHATTLRAHTWTGWRWGDPQARLWHQTLGLSRSQVLRERLDAWILRRLFVPAYEVSERNIDEFIGRLARHRPVLIDGYAESFALLSRYFDARGETRLKPRAVMTSAQILPDAVRTALQHTLGTEVFDKYGSREFSGIAYECRAHRGHHVMAESYIVELLVGGRPARPGEIGEVVITDLNNYAMPLVRYRIGDLAEALDNTEACPCGRGLPRIGRIEGRMQAIVVTADGVWLPGTFFAHFFKEWDTTVRAYRVVQSEPGAFALDLVPGTTADTTHLNAMLSALRGHVGATTRIEVRHVSAIPLEQSGKRTSVVSNVSVDFQHNG